MVNASASIPVTTGVSEIDSYNNLGVEAISQAVPVTQAVTETQSASGNPEQQPAKKKKRGGTQSKVLGAFY